jgi:uncharacterized tellurite resistance protein B-like protein
MMWHAAPMALRRFLGLGDTRESRQLRAAGSDDPETATIRRIVRELEQVEPDRRRHLAGLAYILGRAAHADLTITPEETREMERIMVEIGGLPEAQAVMVVEIAKHQAEMYGGTEDYVVTREFAAHATDEQRRAAVAASFAVVASDHEISAEEYAELTQLARELNLSSTELNDIRRAYRDQLTVIQRMRGQR